MSAPFTAFARETLRRWEEVRGKAARNLIVLRQAASTQDVARRLVKEYVDDGEEVPPAAVLAYEQSGGRGRQGRPWSSPPGAGIYCTMVRRIETTELLRQVPLAVALGLGAVLDEILDDPCGLRWPNDLMVGEDKIAGILVDAVARSEGGVVALIGFGLNHDSGPRAEAPEATAVEDHCSASPGPEALACRLIRSVDQYLGRLQESVWLLERYTAASIHSDGDHLRCRLGKTVKEGTFRGFEEGGYLLLETEEGLERLTAGEIVVEKENGS